MQLFAPPSAQPVQPQPQPQPQPQAAPPMQPSPQAPAAPPVAQDPRSQMLAQAMAAMGKQTQGSAAGLGENLLADALDQFALKQRGQQLNGQANGATPVGQAVSAMANGSYWPAGSMLGRG